MLYRARIDLTFNNEDDCVAFINLVEQIKDKVYKGLPTDGLPVTKTADYHECYHDDNPPQQCGNYADIDIDNPIVKEHKTSDGKVTKYKSFDKSTEKES